jgi:hypothetical protein
MDKLNDHAMRQDEAQRVKRQLIKASLHRPA